MSNITGFSDSHFTSGMRMSLIRLPEFTALGGQWGVGGIHMREGGLQPPGTAPSFRESGHNLVLQRAYGKNPGNPKQANASIAQMRKVRPREGKSLGHVTRRVRDTN